MDLTIFARKILRAFLARRGLALIRTSGDVPPTVGEFLDGLPKRGMRITAAYCFDSDFRVQTDLLAHFPPEKVVFASHPNLGMASLHAPVPMPPSDFFEPFLVEIDAEVLNVAGLVETMPWILRAEVILIRATHGYFWSEKGDLRRTVQWWEDQKFAVVDILELRGLKRLNAQLEGVMIVLERSAEQSRKVGDRPSESAGNGDSKRALGRANRRNEALAYLSQPIARAENLLRLSGRGSFGFKVGVLNAGAIADGGGFTLLARGEAVPWVIAERNRSAFLEGCRPVMIKMDERLSLCAASEVSINRPSGMEGVRFEDFRMFRFRDKVYSNHACISIPTGNLGTARRLQSASIEVSVGISRLDLGRSELIYLGAPTLDRPVGRVEKNWVCFEHLDQLYLLYSFKPFHLLRAGQWPSLAFDTVACQDLPLGLSSDGMPIRNSVNPVDYDRKYLLHVVHKVYPAKQYAFWAVLIEKDTLLPKFITGRPLVCGWHSSPSSIIYVCALVPRDSEVLVFGGLDDSCTAVWRVSRSLLDAHWMPLEH